MSDGYSPCCLPPSQRLVATSAGGPNRQSCSTLPSFVYRNHVSFVSSVTYGLSCSQRHKPGRKTPVLTWLAITFVLDLGRLPQWCLSLSKHRPISVRADRACSLASLPALINIRCPLWAADLTDRCNTLKPAIGSGSIADVGWRARREASASKYCIKLLTRVDKEKCFVMGAISSSLA